MMTLQTQRMLNQLHPKVRELVLACNAQIEVASGWRLHSGEGGAYTCSMNKIWVNRDFDRYKDKFNLIVLHELVHWTGHSTRMARPIVVTSEQGNHRDLTEAQIHTEEMTAQQGAQKLAEQFGIVTNGLGIAPTDTHLCVIWLIQFGAKT